MLLRDVSSRGSDGADLVQLDYEHNYGWHSVSGYRLSDRLILTASPVFATPDPPSGISVVVADHQRISTVLAWRDPRNGAALLRIDGPPPSPSVTAFQWGELGTAHSKFGCEMRYLQPGLGVHSRGLGLMLALTVA
jgi:hypothetical protein